MRGRRRELTEREIVGWLAMWKGHEEEALKRQVPKGVTKAQRAQLARAVALVVAVRKAQAIQASPWALN